MTNPHQDIIDYHLAGDSVDFNIALDIAIYAGSCV